MDYDPNDIVDMPEDNNKPSQKPIERIIVEKEVRPKRNFFWRLFSFLFVCISVLANIVILLVIVGVIAVLTGAGSKTKSVDSEVIAAGPKTQRIAVISVDGLIDDRQYDFLHSQLKAAREDKLVKGVIIRVNSPGGMVSSSDRIYNEILKYRDDTNKPAIAFMQGIAASGGYYTSVACDKIIAEPTVITGSIGVIMNYFVVEGLLKEKAGISPIVIKSGPHKDWPSPYTQPTEEQLNYLQKKVIAPAYKRFVYVVNQGRGDLSIDDVLRLADGSIYSAGEAVDEKLIDAIGYLDDALKMIYELAGIDAAEVIEYKRTFSLTEFLNAKAGFNFSFSRKMLNELSTPELMYLWQMNQ